MTNKQTKCGINYKKKKAMRTRDDEQMIHYELPHIKIYIYELT